MPHSSSSDYHNLTYIHTSHLLASTTHTSETVTSMNKITATEVIELLVETADECISDSNANVDSITPLMKAKQKMKLVQKSLVE